MAWVGLTALGRRSCEGARCCLALGAGQELHPEDPGHVEPAEPVEAEAAPTQLPELDGLATPPARDGLDEGDVDEGETHPVVAVNPRHAAAQPVFSSGYPQPATSGGYPPSVPPPQPLATPPRPPTIAPPRPVPPPAGGLAPRSVIPPAPPPLPVSDEVDVDADEDVEFLDDDSGAP